jgi:hypothetical protein
MSKWVPVFNELREILVPYAASLEVTKDGDTELYLNTRHVMKNKQPLFFAAVQIKKAYVSFHLMPVYLQPELLETISAELKARMQGKSCFNFKAIDPVLLGELTALTKAGYESYREQGYVA